MANNHINSIENRPFIPVRLIPYATGWVISPDSLVKMLSKSDQWHRVFIPSNHLLPDKSYRAMLAKEWDVYKSDMEILDKKLRVNERVVGEGYRDWRKQSIEIIPAGTFVWLDEFEKAYTQIESGMLNPEERPGDRDINLHPLIPLDMRDLVLEGFEEKTEYELAWTDFTETLPKLRASLIELMAIQPESMDARKQKQSEIKKLETQIAELLGQNKTAVKESPAQRVERLAQWLDEEITKSGSKGAIHRVADREGVTRQRISQILKAQD